MQLGKYRWKQCIQDPFSAFLNFSWTKCLLKWTRLGLLDAFRVQRVRHPSATFAMIVCTCDWPLRSQENRASSDRASSRTIGTVCMMLDKSRRVPRGSARRANTNMMHVVFIDNNIFV